MRFGIAKPSGDETDQPKAPGKHDDDESQVTARAGREEYPEIETRLGYSFQDHDWLERALTHRSVQGQGNRNDYERLEFLGDAVLDLAIADLLLKAHPDAREGELSKMRAALVNTSSLADAARRLELGRFVRLSRGELANKGYDRPSILADVFEAVLGAVYREGGYEPAYKCVEQLFGSELKTVTPRDPKTELQEVLHATGSEAPAYMLECVEGPEHAPVFISVVEVDGQIVGRGRGPTKKASQQAAAAEALERVAGVDEIDSTLMASAEEESKADGE